jgi:hypothetical protein
MHLNRYSLRYAAWIILAVWMLALGAGVANACLLSERDHAPPAETHHGAQNDPVDAGCLKFCDEAPLAITKVDQLIADGSPGWVGVLHRTSPPSVASATAVQLWGHAKRPAHMALPTATRPHRLTL